MIYKKKQVTILKKLNKHLLQIRVGGLFVIIKKIPTCLFNDLLLGVFYFLKPKIIHLIKKYNGIGAVIQNKLGIITSCIAAPYLPCHLV